MTNTTSTTTTCDGNKTNQEDMDRDARGSSSTASSSSRRISPPPIPVDRQWLQKLVAKYSNHNDNSNRDDDDDDDDVNGSGAIGTTIIRDNSGNDRHNSNDKNPLWVLAPMVDQSDLAFRLLCRRYGCQLCFTPMIHTKLYTTCPAYKLKFTLQHIPANIDRPLIAQICGSDFDSVLETCLDLQQYCDGIDINCGCPQGIAKRGNYGAFLLEQEDLLVNLVEKLVQHLTVPLSVKVRLLPWPISSTTTRCATTTSACTNAASPNDAPVEQPQDEGDDDDDEEEEEYDEAIPCDENASDHCPTTTNTSIATSSNPSKERALEASMRLYERLVDAGVHMLTIHGRNRLQKGPLTGPADWQAIAQVVQRFGHRIPILANGSIGSRHDALRCLQITGADGIMTSEAILEYPALFHVASPSTAPTLDTNNNDDDDTPEQTRRRTIGRLQLTREYLQLAQEYPPDKGGQASSFKSIRIHVHRFLHADLQAHFDIRTHVCRATSMQDLLDIVEIVQQVHDANIHDVSQEDLSWYRRHSQLVRSTETGITLRVIEQRMQHDATVKTVELDPDAADCFSNLFGLHNEDGTGDY